MDTDIDADMDISQILKFLSISDRSRYQYGSRETSSNLFSPLSPHPPFGLDYNPCEPLSNSIPSSMPISSHL